MARLNLAAGVPEVLAITKPGESVPSNYTKGGFDVLFETASGDRLYIDPERAGDIEREMQELGIRYGEPMRLTKTKTSHGGHAYRVERQPATRDAGGHNVPARSADAYGARFSEALAAPVATQAAATPSAPISAASVKLCSVMCLLMDAMVEGRAAAHRKGLLDISTEDLRCLATTAFLNGGR